MAEKYRIQAMENGEWKTQQIFSNQDSYNDVRIATDKLVVSAVHDDVRILETYENEKTGKAAYRQIFSSQSSPINDQSGERVSEARPAQEPEEYKFVKGLTGEWVQLNEKQARRHPLYGIFGWLAWLAFGFAVRPILGAIELARELDVFSNPQTLISDPSIGIKFGISIVIVCILDWVPLRLLIKKSARFQSITTILYLFVFSIIFIQLIVSGSDTIEGFHILLLGQILLFIGYIAFSERVNVTMKHRARRAFLSNPLGLYNPS